MPQSNDAHHEDKTASDAKCIFCEASHNYLSCSRNLRCNNSVSQTSQSQQIPYYVKPKSPPPTVVTPVVQRVNPSNSVEHQPPRQRNQHVQQQTDDAQTGENPSSRRQPRQRHQSEQQQTSNFHTGENPSSRIHRGRPQTTDAQTGENPSSRPHRSQPSERRRPQSGRPQTTDAQTDNQSHERPPRINGRNTQKKQTQKNKHKNNNQFEY